VKSPNDQYLNANRLFIGEIIYSEQDISLLTERIIPQLLTGEKIAESIRELIVTLQSLINKIPTEQKQFQLYTLDNDRLIIHYRYNDIHRLRASKLYALWLAANLENNLSLMKDLLPLEIKIKEWLKLTPSEEILLGYYANKSRS
jgi:hypothetical protein